MCIGDECITVVVACFVDAHDQYEYNDMDESENNIISYIYEIRV